MKHICQEGNCRKAYTKPGHLKDHVIVCHTREFPYNCTTCGRGFIRPGTYNSHKCNPTDVGVKRSKEENLETGKKIETKSVARKSVVPLEVEGTEVTGDNGGNGLFSCSVCCFSTNVGAVFTSHLTSIEHRRNVSPEELIEPDDNLKEKDEEEECAPHDIDLVVSRSGRKIIPKKFSDDFTVEDSKRKIDLSVERNQKKSRLASPVKPSPTKPSPTKPSPTKTSQAKPSPAKSTPTKPSLTKSNSKLSPEKPCEICLMKFKDNTRSVIQKLQFLI